MAYIRKTVDEYRLYVHYGQGWEHEISESTRTAIGEQADCYRKNCDYPVKWTGPHRVKPD